MLQKGYNTTIVQFMGRGHENFSDEILNIFDWMGRNRREFHPKEIACRAARSGDNYFFWLELNDFPEKTVVEPDHWPPPGKAKVGALTEASVNSTPDLQVINVKPAARGVTLWLSPELVDFNKPIKATLRSKSLPSGTPPIVPDLRVMLEDARTRADRMHPFWAKVEMGNGKPNNVGSTRPKKE
jgi:hypothetical protein